MILSCTDKWNFRRLKRSGMPKLPSTEMTTGKAEVMTGTSKENSKIKIKLPLWSFFFSTPKESGQHKANNLIKITFVGI